MRPRDAREGSLSRSDREEERINVADTEVISLTARRSDGAQGRMIRHCGVVAIKKSLVAVAVFLLT
jgi:hypothetical protein